MFTGPCHKTLLSLCAVIKTIVLLLILLSFFPSGSPAGIATVTIPIIVFVVAAVVIILLVIVVIVMSRRNVKPSAAVKYSVEAEVPPAETDIDEKFSMDEKSSERVFFEST